MTLRTSPSTSSCWTKIGLGDVTQGIRRGHGEDDGAQGEVQAPEEIRWRQIRIGLGDGLGDPVQGRPIMGGNKAAQVALTVDIAAPQQLHEERRAIRPDGRQFHQGSTKLSNTCNRVS